MNHFATAITTHQKSDWFDGEKDASTSQSSQEREESAREEVNLIRNWLPSRWGGKLRIRMAKIEGKEQAKKKGKKKKDGDREQKISKLSEIRHSRQQIKLEIKADGQREEGEDVEIGRWRKEQKWSNEQVEQVE